MPTHTHAHIHMHTYTHTYTYAHTLFSYCVSYDDTLLDQPVTTVIKSFFLQMVLGITVCLGKSEEECPHSQHTSWEGVFTNEGEIR